MDFKKLRQWYHAASMERDQWTKVWSEVATFIHPPSRKKGDVDSDGLELGREAYDATGMRAADDLAAALLGMVFNPETKWCQLSPPSNMPYRKSYQKWLDLASDTVLDMLLDPDVGFYTALHEMLLDYVVFGEGILYMDIDPKTGQLRFNSINIQDCSVQLGAGRKVRSVFRDEYYTPAQMVEKFGEERIPADIRKRAQQPEVTYRYKVIHAVFPRDEGRVGELPTKKPFASVWFLEDRGDKEENILKESGFDYFPYVLPRYSLRSKSTRGEGAGISALPTLRALNVAIQLYLYAHNKNLSPTKSIPYGMLMSSAWDDSPGAINYIDPILAGQGFKVESYGLDTNLTISDALIQGWRQDIRQAFKADKLQAMQKAAEVKEVEFLGDEESRMRSMVPQLVRLYTEAAVPIVRFVLNYIEDRGLMEQERPSELTNMKLRVMSPLSRAQKMLNTTNVLRTITNTFVPLAQINPGVMDVLAVPKIGPWLAEEAGIPAVLLADEEAVEQAQQQRAEQQGPMQQLEMMKTGSEVAKNAAEAIQRGGARAF